MARKAGVESDEAAMRFARLLAEEIARECDEAAGVYRTAGCTHPEESPEWNRCMLRAHVVDETARVIRARFT
ncbi:MAG: hypothetical protein IIZ92_10155 [Aquincola sp.]|nr:hypothetical protein [Aquincola sp.]